MTKNNLTEEQQAVLNELLFVLIGRQSRDEVGLCLQKGADVNARNGNGCTPVMRAVANKNLDVFRVVLQYKPDIFLKDNAGKTVFDMISAYIPASDEKLFRKQLLELLPDCKKEAPEEKLEDNFNAAALKRDIPLGKPLLPPRPPPRKDGGFEL